MRCCLKFFAQPFFKKGWKTTPKRKLLLLRYQHGLAAHVRLQNSRNGHGAVSLQVVLQESNQHARRGNAGVVQGMGQLGLAILILVADAQTACLGRSISF